MFILSSRQPGNVIFSDFRIDVHVAQPMSELKQHS